MPTLELVRESPAWADPLQVPARYKGASGGRASGKSHEFAAMAVEEMVCGPDLRFVCIREVQRSLRESVKRLVEDKIAAFGLGAAFEVQREQIITPGGGAIIF
jgi:phage terminase large subunit